MSSLRHHVRVDLKTDYIQVRHVVAGYLLLAEQGLIDLDFTWGKVLSDTHPERSLLRVDVDGELIAYDCADDYYFDRPTTERLLSESRLYFKRSFDPGTHGGWLHAHRLRPLGFTYPVESRHKAFRELDRANWRTYLKASAAHMAGRQSRPLIQTFEAPPATRPEPHAIFQARVWNPRGEGPTPAEPEVQERRHALNTMRTDCIRLLRGLGPRVTAGLEPTSYALESYPELVFKGARTSKKQYLKRMHTTEISVATLGLGDSNGWKIGEYIASSRAIVSERLRYQVPGDFRVPVNYRDFTTAPECVDQVSSLLADASATHAMQQANQAYYRRWTRPDQMVLRTLEQLEVAIAAKV